MLARISANLLTGKQYNPLGMVVGNRRHTNDFIKKKILDVISQISARSVKRCIYTCMFPMEPMGKLASISASFQKSSKVSISVTLFQVLKDLAEISGQLGPVW